MWKHVFEYCLCMIKNMSPYFQLMSTKKEKIRERKICLLQHLERMSTLIEFLIRQACGDTYEFSICMILKGYLC